MIEANELRIGNLIYEAGEPSRIYQLGSGGISFFTINDIRVNKGTGCTLNEGEIRFKPIPLTLQWLEKMGATYPYKNESNICQIGSELFKLENGEMCLWEADHGVIAAGTRFKYVHQLQNLYFALTGEELTIKS